MGQNTVVIYTTGVAGSGKTYVRCARFLLDELLPYSKLKLISNYPLERARIIDACAEKYGMSREELDKRLEQIPERVLESWRLEQSGPWDYFKPLDISACHIAIDEIHNFCGRHQSKEHRRKWQLWLGEIRHRGATVEFLTQNPQKVAKEIDFECGVRYRIENCENLRDPILGICCSDWYELRAAFITGRYVPTIHQLESINLDGRWKSTSVKRYVLDPEYFQYYDSFSTPVTGGNKAKTKEYDFQRYSKLLLCLHVLRRNYWSIVIRMSIAAVIFWLCFCGGLSDVQKKFIAAVRAGFSKKHEEQAQQEAAKQVPVETAIKSVEASVEGARQGATKPPPVSNAGSVSEPKAAASVIESFLPPVQNKSAVPESPKPLTPEARRTERYSLLCTAAWEQGAAFEELGQLLPGETVNGYRLERSSPRGAVINGVFCRVGVRTSIAATADAESSAAGLSTKSAGAIKR